jgi:hypothetical protein
MYVPIVSKSWDPLPSAALEACLGLYRDSFTGEKYTVSLKIRVKRKGFSAKVLSMSLGIRKFKSSGLSAL